MLKTKEHYELLNQFEREFKGCRLDKEDKAMWPKGYIYQDGQVNEIFQAYQRGYALGKATATA